MNKPKINLESMTYKHPEADPTLSPGYTVYVVNGAYEPPFTQGHVYCSGCGRGHQYRWDGNMGPWIQLKCPTCGTTFAWFEEYGDEDEEEEDNG